MKAAKYAGAGLIVVQDEQVRPPAATEVEISVAYTGICGTDMHVLHGHMDARVRAPQAIGHEMSGRISRVGEDVEGLTPGQAVTVMPLSWCGRCQTCRSGCAHICENLDFVGIDSAGSMQERWTVDARLVVPLPEAIPLRHGALVEPVAVACHDVARSRLSAGELAIVIGGGPIGQLIAHVARAAGARVVLLEPHGARRDMAVRNGIEAMDPTGREAEDILSELSAPAGADVVFEVAGVEATALLCTDLARARGRVVMVAIHSRPVRMNLHTVFWRELEILGARVYERSDFERAVTLLEEKRIPAGQLISDVFPLEKALDAFEKLDSGSAMKVLIDSRSER